MPVSIRDTINYPPITHFSLWRLVMLKNITVYFVVLTALTVNAQTINLRGKVTDSDGKAIAGAIVELVNQKLKDTTGADGAYSITQSDVALLPFLKPQGRTISMNNGGLDLSFPESTPLTIETFDVKGTLLKKVAFSSVTLGFYRFDIAQYTQDSKILVIRVRIDSDEITFRYLPLSNGKYTLIRPSPELLPPKETA